MEIVIVKNLTMEIQKTHAALMASKQFYKGFEYIKNHDGTITGGKTGGAMCNHFYNEKDFYESCHKALSN